MIYTNSSVAGANESTKLLEAKVGRRGFSVRNDSTATLYLAYGATATASSPIKIEAGGFYEDPYAMMDMDARVVDPQINGYWTAANGYARIMEVAL